MAKMWFPIAMWLFCLVNGAIVFAQDVGADLAALAPLDTFQECDVCPEMVVLPMGQFVMGGPSGESRLNIH